MRRVLRRLLAVALLVAFLPFLLGLRFSGAGDFAAGHPSDEAEALLRQVADILQHREQTGSLDLRTGYSRWCGYSAEWDQIFYVFTAMALADLADAQPERKQDISPLLNQCARGILRVPPSWTPQELQARMASVRFGPDAISAGYRGVVLGTYREVTGDTTYDEALRRNNERLAEQLAASLDHITGVWTSDQAVQVYALHLSDMLLGTGHEDLRRRWFAAMDGRFRQPGSGLLLSHVNTGPDAALGEPRGTSLAWTAIFLARVDPVWARRIYEEGCQAREFRLLTLSAVREFPTTAILDFGDLDSGPLLFGFSPAATVFMMCAHKRFGHADRYTRSLRTLELFGQPRTPGDRRLYWLGNGMGDAIILYARLVRPIAQAGD